MDKKPFFDKDIDYMKLHKKLYDINTIMALRAEIDDTTFDLIEQDNYHLLKLDTDEGSDYLEFLNHLIFRQRNA